MTFLRRPFRWLLWLAVIAPGTLSLVGCGSSQDDMIARAMQRSRDDGEDDEDDRPIVRPSPANPTAASASEASDSVTAPPPSAEKVEADLATTQLKVTPIGDRQAERPRSDTERRRRSATNLKVIAEAMKAFADDRGGYPVAHSKTKLGFEGLSWRVRLLPYLGYEELYKRFDLDKRWNDEPNRSLLQYIPDEYVSPDRYDTKTNYQVPVGSSFFFRGHITASVPSVEDGMDNVVLLLEVDDELATEWTRPVDFVPRGNLTDPDSVKEGIGGLRKDGVFAVWGNGWPTLLSNKLPPQLFWASWTIDGGETSLIGQIHQDIPFDHGSDEAVATVEAPSETETLPATAPPVRATLASFDMPANRVAVPRQLDVAESSEKIRGLFADELRDAKNPADKKQLIRQMLAAAAEMESDAAGKYALHSEAIDLATEIGDVVSFLQAVDNQIGSFETDAYSFNAKALHQFLKGNTPSRLPIADRRRLLQRLVRTIAAATEGNRYDQAEALAEMATRVVSEFRGTELHDSVAGLTRSLADAGAMFDRVRPAMDTYRKDPKDAHAASTVGRYLCFVKGDWKRGLPMLVVGGPDSLREIASLDIAGAGDVDGQVRLGDRWWDMSRSATSPTYRDGAMDRALTWYRMALPSMQPSLDRMQVQARIQDEDRSAGPPLSRLRKLSDEIGVDLSVPLAAVRTTAVMNIDDDDID